MTSAVLGRWGKSLAVRIPSDVAGSLALAEGVTVEIETRDDAIFIRKADRTASLADLFQGRTSEEWRQLYRASAVDFGPDVGREVVED